jgi:D-xylose transport system ATP-binding protein
MKQIGKSFGGVRALDGVSLEVKRGEIHGLCGENGAGKSTLMKILSGVYPYGSYEGEFGIDGITRKFSDVGDSELAGVAIIYQEFTLVKEMTIAENIFLGIEPGKVGFVDSNKMYSEASVVLKTVGLNLNPTVKVKKLGIGQQQLVEIAKALTKKARILILDEPTAALTEEEVKVLMQIIGKLRNEGMTCIYISHKLSEVLEIADRITVLRDGRTIATVNKDEITEGDLIRMMVGREITNRFPKVPAETGEIALEVKGFSVLDKQKNREVLSDIAFQVHYGEILGVAGLMGAGRTELLMSLFGATDWEVKGHISVQGKELHIRGPQDAIEAGIGLVSEDRRRYGLVMPLSVMENISLATLDRLSHFQMIDLNQEVKSCKDQIRKMQIKTPHLQTVVSNLSGGNQQKVVLARWLMREPRILFLDEPTRGIDVGAKYDIYVTINELAKSGMAIVMVSSELPELIGMADRIIVMREGRITGHFSRSEFSQERIMECATGGKL